MERVTAFYGQPLTPRPTSSVLNLDLEGTDEAERLTGVFIYTPSPDTVENKPNENDPESEISDAILGESAPK